MRSKVYIAFLLILFYSSTQIAFAQKRNSLTITSDHLTLQLDLRSSKKAIDSILNIAGIDATGIHKIQTGDYSVLNNDGWRETKLENNIIEFERSLQDLNNNPQSRPLQITTRINMFDVKPGYPELVKFGINKYNKITVYELASGLTRFILPDYQRAKRVFLSGSFNGWSTLRGLMKKTDGGWLLDIKLAPGAYEYKYIADGRWIIDPNNLLQADDGDGHINSIYFKYNYTFKLNAYASAHRITLTGDFNNWDGNQVIMEKKGGGWERQVYLIDGSHTYHYIVDGQWVTDPANPLKIKAEDGKENSVLNFGDAVDFKLNGFNKAKNVYVAGNFNGWKPNDINLKKTGDGWQLPVILIPGNYNYKFIADGKWVTDPENPFYAVEDGVTNSFVSVRPNHTFILKGYSKAGRVELIGSFTKWEAGAYTMAHKGDEWVIALYLRPGKYIYRFIVDGQQLKDPLNKLYEPGDNDTVNSVLWME